MKPNSIVLTALQEHTSLEFYASALYSFDSITQKKKAKYFLADKTPLTTKKAHNTVKAYITDNILVFDLDDPALYPHTKLEQDFPSLATTLQTHTSRPDKRHYYVTYTHEDLQRLRDTSSIPGLDILTTGVIQEAYPCTDKVIRSGVHTDAAMVHLTEAEEYKLLSMVNTASATVAQGTFHQSYPNLVTINKFIAEGIPERQTEVKQLLEAILPNDLYKSKYKRAKSGIKLPQINYQLFNDIVTKVSYNRAISVDKRQEFIHSLLAHYKIDPYSVETERRLAQILPSLPCNEGYIPADFENFEDYLKGSHLRLYNAYIIKYISGKDTVFVLIDDSTYKPKIVSHDEGFMMTLTSIKSFVLEDVLYDMAEGTYGDEKDPHKIVKRILDRAPLVKPVNHPSLPIITFDDGLMLPQYNITQQSKYVEEASPLQVKPDNTIMRLITSVFGEHEDFYLYLLAHQVFSPNPPQTVPFIVSGETASGKTSVAGHIPTALIQTARSLTISDISSGWGDILMATKWIGVNDLRKLSKEQWVSMYSFIKDTTTGGQRRLINSKFGGISTATLPTISMSVSSNYYFPIDRDDRRLWVIRPQHLEIDDKGNPLVPSLSPDDADSVHRILEAGFGDHHEELQQLANHILYLYQNDSTKYMKEMTQRAPITKYKIDMIDKHSTYTSRIISAIKAGPEVFNNILEAGEARTLIYKFIAYSSEDLVFCAPYKFLAYVIHSVQGEDSFEKVKVAQVASSLDIPESDFKNRSKHWFDYKDNKPDEFTQAEYAVIMQFTYNAILINIPKGTIRKYKEHLIGMPVEGPAEPNLED